MAKKNFFFKGKVFHERFLPKKNRFVYPVFFIHFPLSRVQELKSLFFSVDGFNLYSFHHQDHGDGSSASLKSWLSQELKKNQIHTPLGEAWCQTFPRILGYVFNPVSFWSCYDEQNKLFAIILEVNNTYGERHCYTLPINPEKQHEKKTFAKDFFVSPFFSKEGNYEFSYQIKREQVSFQLDYLKNQKLQLKTFVQGKAIEHNAMEHLKAFFKVPFMTLWIFFLIHFQAAILFFGKKLPVFSYTPQVKQENNYEHV